MGRPKYNEEAGRLGRETEIVMMQFLHRVYMLDYWFNALGENFDVDFRLRDGRYLECERKDAKYERFFETEGVDFLHEKVERYSLWEEGVMYAMVPSHHKYFYIASCDDIKNSGQLIQKDTTREKGEWFYRMKLHRLKKVEII